MIRIALIAKQTLMELVRDRILHGLIVVFILFSLFSLVLGQLSFAEQLRITLNFSLSVMHLIAAALTILLGAQAVQKEVDRKTIYTVLARPVLRHEYLLGKFFGVYLIVLITVFICALALLATLYGMGASALAEVSYTALGILFESFIILAIAFALSQVLKPAAAIFCATGVFLTGHWIETLKGLSAKDKESLSQFIYSKLIWIVPNLENWNWKTLVVYEIYPSSDFMLFAGMEAILWGFCYLTIALILFERRELVS